MTDKPEEVSPKRVSPLLIFIAFVVSIFAISGVVGAFFIQLRFNTVEPLLIWNEGRTAFIIFNKENGCATTSDLSKAVTTIICPTTTSPVPVKVEDKTKKPDEKKDEKKVEESTDSDKVDKPQT